MASRGPSVRGPGVERAGHPWPAAVRRPVAAAVPSAAAGRDDVLRKRFATSDGLPAAAVSAAAVRRSAVHAAVRPAAPVRRPVRPDGVRAADLRAADLRGANLRGADLRRHLGHRPAGGDALRPDGRCARRPLRAGLLRHPRRLPAAGAPRPPCDAGAGPRAGDGPSAGPGAGGGPPVLHGGRGPRRRWRRRGAGRGPRRRWAVGEQEEKEEEPQRLRVSRRGGGPGRRRRGRRLRGLPVLAGPVRGGARLHGCGHRQRAGGRSRGGERNGHREPPQEGRRRQERRRLRRGAEAEPQR
ncbi:pentapeptide repeat-containing protein [Streptomyces sp. NPDC059176]|uniref:pentapeptide repeat-containing protein n=1 Tax=unclassified Streptomyces TaxID=2593676 RepID=UPI003684BF65